MFSKVQQWLAKCEIAQDIPEVNYGIVVFSRIMEDIWKNRFSVHLPYVFKVKPIDWGGETPFGLGNPGGGVKSKRKSNSGGEVDDRVSNNNSDKDLKMKKMRTGKRCYVGPTPSTE